MGDIKDRIGLGTVGNANPGANDIGQSSAVDNNEILTADRTDITADTTRHTADEEKV